MKTQKKQRCFIYVNFKSWKSHCVFIFLKTFYPLVPNMEICHKHFLDKIFTKQSLCKVWEERARTSNSIIFLLHLDPSSYRVLNIRVYFFQFRNYGPTTIFLFVEPNCYYSWIYRIIWSATNNFLTLYLCLKNECIPSDREIQCRWKWHLISRSDFFGLEILMFLLHHFF